MTFPTPRLGSHHPQNGIYTVGGIRASTRKGILRHKMTHVVHEKQKLLNRIRRLRGQVDGIERALETDAGCNEIMRQLATVRGAINGIMAEVVEDHIQMHMVDANRKPTKKEIEAADELVEVLRSYIR
jgi:DNA-binding FrmR family transcriptional regulator